VLRSFVLSGCVEVEIDFDACTRALMGGRCTVPANGEGQIDVEMKAGATISDPSK
jgi:hypothetical protein